MLDTNQKKTGKFGKLVKYEFSAIGRKLLPIYGAVLLLGLLSGIFTKIQGAKSFDDLNVINIILILCFVLYGFFIMAAIIFSYVISITHFKSSILGNNGYLMNTLPVNPWQNIASKAIASVVYQILGLVVAGVSGIFLLLPISNVSQIDMHNVITQLAKVINQYGAQITLYGIESIVICIVALFSTNLMFYASLSIGHSFNNKKVFKSVCSFIGLYIISQIINSAILKIGNLYDVINNMTGIYAPQPFFIGIIVLELLYSVAYFVITNYFIKNKLNLQ